MSKGHDNDAHGATTIRASKGGGGGGKLLVGVVAAAVLLGGGYLAYKNFAPQNGAQTAYNDSYATEQYGDDPLRAGPVETRNAIDDLSASEETASPASETSAPPARRRTAAARTEEVPEATIGVTPINVTTDGYAASESPDLVVTAARSPVWDRTPSSRRLSAMYPERALERGREGEARLHCTVLDGGALDCAKTSETPGGFGNAALRVARTLRHAPQFADGSVAAGSPVNLRVVFRIDDSARRG